MGILKWLFGKRDYSVNAGRDITGSTIHQGDVYQIGSDGRTCPYNWQLSYSTCGCCPNMNTCKEGRAFIDSERKRFSNFD